MQTSPFMNTKCSIKGYEFAPNNFCAPLEKSVFPDDFHIIIDFLTCSPIYYALTQPTKVTFKSVMQIWSTLKFINGGQTEKSKLTFNYNGKEYVITPEVVEEALHLPKLEEKTPEYITADVLIAFLKLLGYNGDPDRIGVLQRSRLKKQWNLYFDCITRCFLNKVSNFDAIPSGSLEIGYSLIYNTVFDYGNFILNLIGTRKEDKLKYICYVRFLQLIFNHMCPSADFPDDELVPISKISETGIKAIINGDKKNNLEGECFVPKEVWQFLSTNMTEKYNLVTTSVPSSTTDMALDSSPIRQSPKRKIKDISKQKSKVKKKKVVASGMASDNKKKEMDSRDTQMQKPPRKRKLRILDVDSDRDESTPPSVNISNTETIDPANSGKKAETNVYKRKRLVKCSNYVPTLQFNELVEEKVNPLPELDEMMIQDMNKTTEIADTEERIMTQEVSTQLQEAAGNLDMVIYQPLISVNPIHEVPVEKNLQSKNLNIKHDFH